MSSEYTCLYHDDKLVSHKCTVQNKLSLYLSKQEALKILPEYCKGCLHYTQEIYIHHDVDGDLLQLSDTLKDYIDVLKWKD